MKTSPVHCAPPAKSTHALPLLSGLLVAGLVSSPADRPGRDGRLGTDGASRARPPESPCSEYPPRLRFHKARAKRSTPPDCAKATRVLPTVRRLRFFGVAIVRRVLAHSPPARARSCRATCTRKYFLTRRKHVETRPVPRGRLLAQCFVRESPVEAPRFLQDAQGGWHGERFEPTL